MKIELELVCQTGNHMYIISFCFSVADIGHCIIKIEVQKIGYFQCSA